MQSAVPSVSESVSSSPQPQSPGSVLSGSSGQQSVSAQLPEPVVLAVLVVLPAPVVLVLVLPALVLPALVLLALVLVLLALVVLLLLAPPLPPEFEPPALVPDVSLVAEFVVSEPAPPEVPPELFLPVVVEPAPPLLVVSLLLAESLVLVVSRAGSSRSSLYTVHAPVHRGSAQQMCLARLAILSEKIDGRNKLRLG